MHFYSSSDYLGLESILNQLLNLLEIYNYNFKQSQISRRVFN